MVAVVWHDDGPIARDYFDDLKVINWLLIQSSLSLDLIPCLWLHGRGLWMVWSKCWLEYSADTISLVYHSLIF